MQSCTFSVLKSNLFAQIFDWLSGAVQSEVLNKAVTLRF